ncbi:protein CASPARIAN STRIP INTEGRITY FACTOR 2-like [Raphanus sativus]|uniref:Protein CASPARIAN STRIP INTEGRITY FACTOR 2-like n=1 Tax=Raphanus sativus TaxID=3726 RepID=A0A6J0NJL5_RAPSA|nr:protein CASPARIAN STRIP INTEGRITY FACTOR 2-like [Raphanus sativus]
MYLLQFVKKLGFVCLLVSATMFAFSSAGRPSILIYSQDDIHQELVERRIHEHERILRMNSRDYGQFSPTPKLVRPPSKLIPN